MGQTIEDLRKENDELTKRLNDMDEKLNSIEIPVQKDYSKDIESAVSKLRSEVMDTLNSIEIASTADALEQKEEPKVKSINELLGI